MASADAETRAILQDWFTLVPPDSDAVLRVHRPIGPGRCHTSGAGCVCEPVLIRRSEFPTVGAALAYLTRATQRRH